MLCNALVKKGYHIFLNQKRTSTICFDSSVFSIPLSLEEIYCLAEYSKGIIALRSGLIDLLSKTNVSKHIIYNDYLTKELTAAENLFAFSLKKLPYTKSNTIFEYVYSYIDEYIILEKIIEGFE